MTSSTVDLAKRVEALVKSGKSLQEALQVALGEVKAPVPAGRIDHIAYIASLRDLPEVRRVRKIAYAKISKSKGKTEAIARYKLEIVEADKKLNELLAEVDGAEVPWMKAMELGENAAGAFNFYLGDYEAGVEAELKDLKLKANLTNAQLKAALQVTKVLVPNDVPEVFREVILQRINNGDMRLITIARKAAFVLSLKVKA